MFQTADYSHYSICVFVALVLSTTPGTYSNYFSSWLLSFTHLSWLLSVLFNYNWGKLFLCTW